MANAQLPKWLTRRKEDGVMLVNADIAYPAVLKALGVQEVDQYWAECALQIVKLEVQDIVKRNPSLQPPEGRSLAIEISAKDKDRWAVAGLPRGRGWEAATRGREAVVHYERVRGQF